MAYDKEDFLRYPFHGIPRTLWDKVHQAAKTKGMTIRVWLLEAIKEKLDVKGR